MHGRESKKVTESDSYRLTREAFNIVCIGGMVSLGLMPFDSAMHFFHTRKKGSLPFSPAASGPSVAAKSFAVRTMAAAVGRAVQGGVQKNFFLQSREPVARNLDGLKAESEVTGTEVDAKSEVTHISIQSAIAASTVIGLLDALAGNRNAVQKTLDFQQLLSVQVGAVFTRPLPSTPLEQIKLSVAGVATRTGKCGMGIFGLMCTSMLQKKIEALLPPGGGHIGLFDYSNLVATIVAGSVSGSIGNVFELIYKRQIVQMSPTTFRTPPASTVCKELLKAEGLKGFARGMVPAMVYQVVANEGVQIAEKIADKYCLPAFDRGAEYVSKAPAKVKKQAAQWQGTLFQPAVVKPTPGVEKVRDEARNTSPFNPFD